MHEQKYRETFRVAKPVIVEKEPFRIIATIHNGFV
jgi:hypothetical protein